jgi:hypothetical protein
MRTPTEIRERAINTLTSMLARPSMWGQGQSFEASVRGLLRDIAFIDDRDAELDHAFAQLEAEGLWVRWAPGVRS